MNVQEYIVFRHTLANSKWMPNINFDKKQAVDTSPQEIEDLLKEATFSSPEETTCFVSGGVDSSLLAAIAKPKDVYMAYFDHILLDEVEWAERAADHIGTNLNKILITKKRYMATMEYLIRRKGDGLHPNEPCLYLVAQQMRRDGYKVVFSGEGADDLFGGYSDLLLNEKKYMKDKESLFDRYSYTERATDNVFDFDTYKKWGMEQFILRVHTPGLITRGLNACGSAGMGVKFPYLTNELQQVMWETKKSLKKEKILLKRVAESYLPKALVHRKKVGFPIPVDEWFGGIEKFLQFNVDIWRSIN